MKYALINGVLLDGTRDMKPEYNKVILVKDRIIQDIIPIEHFNSEDYTIIDLKGNYILPGLINLHVHLAGSGKPKNNSSDAVRLVKMIRSNALTNDIGHRLVAKYAKTQLMSGTTTIRTVGGIADYDTMIRDKIRAGKCVGPRILAANMAISVEQGHMAGSLAYIAHNEKEAAHYVDVISKDRPNLIKLMITGGVSDATKRGEPGIVRMSPEIVRAACNRAHALGYQVAAHVESTEGVRIALENGVDSIEHGAKPTKEIMDLMKKRNAFQVMTISPALPFAEFDKDVMHITDIMQENGKIVLNGIIDMAKECLENDIPVGLGTDTACPYVTQYDMWRELYYYVKYCHVTPAFALYSATLLNASLAGIDTITGSIAPHKSADMIVVKENPLEHIEALRNIEIVFFEGKKYKPQLKKIKVVEDKLDEYM